MQPFCKGIHLYSMAKIIRINKVKQLKDYQPLMSVSLKEKLWKGIKKKIGRAPK